MQVCDDIDPGDTNKIYGLARFYDPISPRTITNAANFTIPVEIKQELIICFSKRDRREIGYAHIARQHLDHIFGVHDNETSLFGRRMSKAEERELKGQMGMIGAMGAGSSVPLPRPAPAPPARHALAPVAAAGGNAAARAVAG